MSYVHCHTTVFIRDRGYRVTPLTDRVFSGPYPGGVYRPLPNQDGQLARTARELATGRVFNEDAYSFILEVLP